MVLLRIDKIIIAILRNFAHKVHLSKLIRKIFRLKQRGGVRWQERSLDGNISHILYIFNLFFEHISTTDGKVGIEIGAGDNYGVSFCFLKSGAQKMYAVERYESLSFNEWNKTLMQHLEPKIEEDLNKSGSRVMTKVGERDIHIINEQFEHIDVVEHNSVDFIVSNDVMEHVNDHVAVFQKASQFLKKGGLFINNIDLAGHNAFSNIERPLDFLTCPGWLWNLMFSSIVTTNRVRMFEFRFTRFICTCVSASFQSGSK